MQFRIMFNNKKVEEGSVMIRPYQALSREVDAGELSKNRTFLERRRVRKASSSSSDELNKGQCLFVFYVLLSIICNL